MSQKIIYNSALYDIVTGAIDLDTDSFKGMLVGNTYRVIADETKRDSHLKRSDITNEISGTGYTAGGQALNSIAVTKDTTNNIIKMTCANPSWSASTLAGVEGFVAYKSRGGASSADELLCFLDLYTDNGNAALSTSGGTLTITMPANGIVTIEPKSGS